MRATIRGFRLTSMKIVIEKIDADSGELLGCTPSPSFIVQFRGLTFNGIARLVPASGVADARPDDELVVELAQESVSDFKVNNSLCAESVAALVHPGDFEVHGTVIFVSPLSDVFYVAAGEARFCLTLEEADGFFPCIGTMVGFKVHDVSMWDVAI